MIFAQVADLVTYLAMGPEHELNPLVVAIGPHAAVLAKVLLIAALAAFLPALYLLRPRLSRFIRRLAIVTGCFGAASNVATILM